MGCSSVHGEPINQYGLVTYLPDELGAYLDQMRRDLVVDCKARSHISLLPPRPIHEAISRAEAQIHHVSLITQPFVVRAGNVAVFPKTSVIYLELEAGQEEIERLHRELATDALAYAEPFPFHPHITLAQNFCPDTVEERVAVARDYWRGYQGRREFLLDRVVFVQNTANNCWMDLRTFAMQGLPVGPGTNAAMELTQTF
jgi:2'-5' RNA ligase